MHPAGNSRVGITKILQFPQKILNTAHSGNLFLDDDVYLKGQLSRSLYIFL